MLLKHNTGIAGLAILIFLVLAGCRSHSTGSGNENPADTSAQFDYRQAWNKIDSLEHRGLYKSASSATLALQRAAIRDNARDHLVRSVIYLNKYTVHLEEDGYENALLGMENAIGVTEGSVQSILYSLTAELYARYLQANFWRLRDRTQVSGEPGGDIRTWGINHLLEKINDYYFRSVADEDLKKVSVSDYTGILTHATTDSLRPTLYDFLAQRAIDYFMQDYGYLTEPVYAYALTDPALMSPAGQFVDLELAARDTRSYKRKTLQLMQDVIAFHMDDPDPAAFVDADLQRLQFVHTNIQHERGDALYLTALEDLREQYDGHVVSAEIQFHIAQFYYTRGSTNTVDTIGHWRKAHQICTAAIEAFPDSYGASNCRNLLAQIEHKVLQARTEEVWIPGEYVLLHLSYRNVSNAFMRVVHIPLDERERFNDRNETVMQWLSRKVHLEEKRLQLPGTEDFHEHTTEHAITPLKPGTYAVLLSGSEKFDDTGLFAYTVFHVSGIAFWQEHTQQGDQFVIVDRRSGAPLQGASVDFYQYYYNAGSRQQEMRMIGKDISSADGLVQVPGDAGRRQAVMLKISYREDHLFLQDRFHMPSVYREQQPRQRTLLFTDRAIYRPGQTIYFKGYTLSFDTESMPSIASGTTVTVQLIDANGQGVDKVRLTSNAYGTFSGSFQTPEGRLLGNMQLRASPWNGQTSVQVEEYKRPTFEVTIDSLKEAVSLGDQVIIDGKAMTYAGVPVTEAAVSYRVVRHKYYPYFPSRRSISRFPQSGRMEISHGQTQTGSDGAFAFSFLARDDESARRYRPEYIFEVHIDVTDIAGETRSGVKRVVLGSVGFRVSMDMQEQMSLAALQSPAVRAENLNGEPLSLSGDVKIERLEAPARTWRERLWNVPDEPVLSSEDYLELFPGYAPPGSETVDQWSVLHTLSEHRFTITGDDQIPLQTAEFKPGPYRLTFAFRSHGDTLRLVRYVRAIDTSTDLLPPYEPYHLLELPEKAAPGDSLSYALISGQDLSVRQHVDRRSGLDAFWLHRTLNRSARTIPVMESDRGGLTIFTTFVFDNRMYQLNQVIHVPWSNKQLHFEYLSYRDITEPGEEQEWRLRISGDRAEAVTAEMLATMYDASLDAFVPHNWNMSLYPRNRSSLYVRQSDFQPTHMRVLHWFDVAPVDPRVHKSYRQVNWFDFPFYGFTLRMRDAHGIAKDEAAESAAHPQADFSNDEQEQTEAQQSDAAAKAVDSYPESSQDQKPLPIRRDLDETVFFFPHISTEEDGTTTLRFRMKESLTRWKFLALAHTQDLKYGLSSKEIVTQKSLMVFPNFPRFLREGDTLKLASKVFNATDSTLAGYVTLKLKDGLSGESLDTTFSVSNIRQLFSLTAQSAASFQWEMIVPEDFTTPVTYQVIASTGMVGDGQEGLMPVLSDRVFITESLAMHVDAESTRVFTFEALDKDGSTTLTPHGMTLEFTSNPAWYAVQALPYLSDYPHACTEQQFSRLYANLLGAHITSRFPAIQQIFEAWQQEEEGTSLQSKLAGNEELKSALLEETPWVRDAMDEEEQMRNIALLFDQQNIDRQKTKTMALLREAQLANGGFPWFAGGRDNWYITQYIVEGTGHLIKLGALSGEYREDFMPIVTAAVQYIDRRVTEQYTELERAVEAGKTRWEEDHLSHIITHYLYVRSFFPDIALSEDAAKARDYYLTQAENFWPERPLYIQGLIALALHRWIESAEVSTMLQSFRERALQSDELGTYWKSPHGYFWYELPLERQALMIELFEEIGASREWIDGLRLWLLNNKRTNRWETTKSTTAAIYALLMHEESWLHGEPVRITVGDRVVGSQDALAGTNYVKQRWQGEEITEEFREIKVVNPNNHIAWGGAYWQYFEDLDKVQADTGTPLKVSKSVWKEVQTDRGPELRNVRSGGGLGIGDKLVVRIEIEVDREMEFIHLKDMRGSGLEPVNVLSQYKWQGGLGYYESTGDLATHFFIDYLPRGKWVFEYPLRVAQSGNYANGIATLQSMYAPEFSSHSNSVRLHVR